MESFPIVVITEIVKHLNPRDLSACCAVSREWRMVFDHDSLWRPLCDHGLEEYLRTTPCVVRPGFVSPEMEDSSLSPVSRWRMAYMRENHLLNNWRHHNVITTLIPHRPSEFRIYDFLSNDLLVEVREWSKIKVWDVRGSPAQPTIQMLIKKAELGYCSIRCLNSSRCLISNEQNVLLIIRCSFVWVFCFRTCTYNVFNIQENEMMTFSQYKKRNKENTVKHFSVRGIVKGSVFIGFVTEEPTKLHIWCLKTMLKLKEVKCPESTKACFLKTCSTTEYIVVTMDNPKCIRIFDPKRLAFLQFSHPLQEFPIILIQNHYIAISNLTSISVIDYFTSELMFSKAVSEPYHSVWSFKNGFVFNMHVIGAETYNTKTRSLTFHPGKCLKYLLSSRFGVLEADRFVLWEVGKEFVHIDYSLKCTNQPNVISGVSNQSETKLWAQYLSGHNKIIHFW